ncbi:DUF1579 family protein [Kribbella monticola]|uniref:DUF1579 family protein n=1 Tax=Kribbella monticola TaxID=2185285 RepID=UPI000DD40EC7|nr:DUF1579 family protein [Kribbella monticola]
MTTISDTVPAPITPGPEMQALARFHRDVSWDGVIQADGMGPGTPRMTATGTGLHHVIQDGRWIVGDYEQDQYLLDGTFVLRWQLHWVAGWDPTAQEYRATIADCYGHTDVLRGRIDGDLLTFQTMDEHAPVRIRLYWHLEAADRIIWRNELSLNGGPFELVERYVCRPRDLSAMAGLP